MIGFRQGINRKTLLAAVVVIVPGLVLLIGLLSRRPPRVPMERYIPATALAFIEVDSLVDLFDGLTGTMAWRELAPELGLSSQLDDIGWVADLMGRTGLGPAEAVLAGRAQLAVAITGLDAESGSTDDGPYVRFKPRIALIIATHSDPETAKRLVRDRTSFVAQRIYGKAEPQQQEDYLGSDLSIFSGPTAERKLVAGAAGSIIVLGNQEESVKACLDAINGRVDSLAANKTLKEFRPAVDRNASIFAFITEGGTEKLAKIGPVLFAGRFTSNPERLESLANLFGHMAKQTIHGFLYSAELTDDGVTDRYLTVLAPLVAPEFAEALATTEPAFDSMALVPPSVEDLTVVGIKSVEQLPDRVLKRLSPKLDLVAGLALREFVLGIRREFGIESADQAQSIFGDELTFLRFGGEEPVAMLFRVKNQSRAAELAALYLKRGGMSVSIVNDRGIDVTVSTNPDGRAAALIDGHLVLATERQIGLIIDARGKGLASNDRVNRLLRERPRSATVISFRASAEDAATMMLAVSELVRATDGSRDILDRPQIRAVIDRLPPTMSFTDFREYGVYTETRSAIGNFDAAGLLLPERGDK